MAVFNAQKRTPAYSPHRCFLYTDSWNLRTLVIPAYRAPQKLKIFVGDSRRESSAPQGKIPFPNPHRPLQWD